MPRKKRDMAIEEPGRMRAAPGAGIDKLEPRRAVLEGMVELLGKGRGRRPGDARRQGEDDPGGEPGAGA